MKRSEFKDRKLKNRNCSALEDSKATRKKFSKVVEEIDPGKSKMSCDKLGIGLINANQPTSRESAKWEFDEKDPAEIAKSVENLLYRLKNAGALKKIKEEFMRIKSYMPEGPKEAFVANESKNRYRDILLLDNTRVILRNRECDYIHASRVTIGRNVFICTQGPLCNTAESFWAMVIQEKVKLIVMLCKFIEEGKEKCCEYFPKREGSLEIGKFLIECKSREVIPETDGVTCGKLEVTYMGKKTKVEHLWYENWFDHAAPDNFRAAFDLIRLAREKRMNSPVVVHCSAVGRSGCFVAVELALHEAATKSVFRMDTVLKDLRDQRMHCVQSDMQYLFVHRGLVEFLITRGVTKRMDVLKFITDYDNLIKRKRGKADSADGKENRAPPKKAEYTPSVYCNDTYY